MTVPTERPTGTHSERERALRRAIARETDPATLRLLIAWADDEYVARAHRRAADPEVRRLRRQLREAA